jgi:hypothetical protein
MYVCVSLLFRFGSPTERSSVSRITLRTQVSYVDSMRLTESVPLSSVLKGTLTTAAELNLKITFRCRTGSERKLYTCIPYISIQQQIIAFEMGCN